MTRTFDPHDRHLRGLVAARTIAARDGISTESVDLDEAALAPPIADDVIGRVEDAMSRIPPDEIGDAGAFRAALSVLLRETGKAARKLDEDPGAPLTAGEAVALEAVIRADGTRPSLLVRDDAVDPDHPLAGDWSGTLRTTQGALKPLIRAVGRIEPAMATARSYFGTGWVVDSAAGLVLTNLHVLEAMWRRHADRMQRTDTGFRVHGDTVFVDFAAESGRVRTNRFRVVEATPSGVDGAGYARLDAAVLRIEPTSEDEQNVPGAVPVVADTDGPMGNIASFCTVGYPGPPEFTGGVHDGVDWTWVNTTLFGGRYGVKRLAPGIVHQPLGSIAGDERPWVLGHDATTLGGASGSPVLTWLDAQPGGFGLHFAGATTRTNVAHAVAACAQQLRAIGVPVADPS
jgi:Trypsin-like peptidase domain